jgi:hypothetical protein
MAHGEMLTDLDSKAYWDRLEQAWEAQWARPVLLEVEVQTVQTVCQYGDD